MEFRFLLNGKAESVNSSPERMLIDLLREEYGIRSLRRGCSRGECGTCTVLIDGVPVFSCLVPMFRIPGSDIVTVEGLMEKPEYRYLGNAFKEADYTPCDYCRPSVMILAYSILGRSLEPRESEILDAFSGRSCSCTDLEKIIGAVRSAGRMIRGHIHE